MDQLPPPNKSPKIDPDKSSSGIYDMAEILVDKFNWAVSGTNYENMFDDSDMLELLKINFGNSMLNRLIKTDMGQGIIVGYLVGLIEMERIEEAEDGEEAP